MGDLKRDERGVAVVEASIVVFLLALLAFAVVEYSLLIQHQSQLHSASGAGARAGSATGATAVSDVAILSALNGDDSSFNESSITDVVIYAASTADGAVPNECNLHSVVGVCDHYSAADLTAGDAAIGNIESGGWPSSDRMYNGYTGDAFIGVQVKATHHWITRLFPFAPRTVTARTVMRIEPGNYTPAGIAPQTATVNPNPNSESWTPPNWGVPQDSNGNPYLPTLPVLPPPTSGHST